MAAAAVGGVGEVTDEAVLPAGLAGVVRSVVLGDKSSEPIELPWMTF